MRIRIRDLIKQLEDNGFVLVRTRGDHRIYEYRNATISGRTTDNAPHYLIAQVQDAIEAAGGTWED